MKNEVMGERRFRKINGMEIWLYDIESRPREKKGEWFFVVGRGLWNVSQLFFVYWASLNERTVFWENWFFQISINFLQILDNGTVIQ